MYCGVRGVHTIEQVSQETREVCVKGSRVTAHNISGMSKLSHPLTADSFTSSLTSTERNRFVLKRRKASGPFAGLRRDIQRVVDARLPSHRLDNIDRLFHGHERTNMHLKAEKEGGMRRGRVRHIVSAMSCVSRLVRTDVHGQPSCRGDSISRTVLLVAQDALCTSETPEKMPVVVGCLRRGGILVHRRRTQLF